MKAPPPQICQKIACKSLAQDELEVVNTSNTTTMEELLMQLVQEVKGMNTWLESISGDVAIQGGMLVKLQMDRGCNVCWRDVGHGLAEVESEEDIQESQKPSMFYY